MLGVTVHLEKETAQIYNIYHRPTEIEELLELCTSTNVFIGGDFNAHHTILGSARHNRSGQLLAEAMQNTPEATLLNTGEPTHIAGGVLDLSFASPHLCQGAKWELHEHLASDHFATISTLNCPKLPSPNYTVFRTVLHDQLQTTVPGDELDAKEHRLINAFHTAAEASIPQTKKQYKDRWYHDERVAEYHHRINQARKLHRRHCTQATRDLLRAAIRTGREGKKQIKNEKWLEWCASMNSHTKLGDLWKHVKKATEQRTLVPPNHPDPES